VNGSNRIVYEERMVGDRRVRIGPERGKPLMLLVRLFPYNMGIWDNVWNELSEHYTLATFNLPVPKFDEGTDPREVLHALAGDCVAMAAALGHPHFHLFGWHGGAQVALRAAIDFPERVLSCVLQGAIYEPLESRPTDIALKIVEAVVGTGDLEFLTYYVLLSGTSPEYAELHFDVLEKLVKTRLEVDRGRLDAVGAMKWGRLQRRYRITDAELDRVTAPVLLVAPVGAVWPPFHLVRRLYERMRTAELAVVPRGGDLVIFEDPEAFFAAAWRFLQAASKGERLPKLDAVEYLSPSGELRSAVSERRAEDAIVFLHGWLMSPQIWQPAMSALHERVRCAAIWQPAHGPTGAPPAGFTMDDWAEWLATTLDNVGVRRAVLVGHSMGGMLALAMRARYPERVRGLVLVATQATDWNDEIRTEFNALADVVATDWSPEVAQQCSQLLLGEAFLAKDSTWRERWEREVAGYELSGNSALGRAISNRPDYSADGARGGIPTLVVHGSEDVAIAPETGRALAAAFAGAEFVEIPGSGHCPPLEAPQAFADELLRFLEAHELIRAPASALR